MNKNNLNDKSKLKLVFNENNNNNNSLKFKSFINKVFNNDYDSNISMIIKNLYLGNFENSKNINLLLENNIKVIINVTDDLPNTFIDKKDNNNENMFYYYRIPIKDSIVDIKQYFNETFNLIDFYLNKNQSIFVHCFAGVSRSASIIISYLMKKYNLLFKESYDYVLSKRKIIEPNFYFCVQLISYEKELNNKELNNKDLIKI